MEQHEKQDMICSSMPILQRLDRLDRLLECLEYKHCSKHSSSASVSCSSSSASKSIESEDQSYKSFSSAIEEAHQKGTLMERIAVLENRVLQLRNEMDVVSASKSSCSSILVPEDKQDPFATQECYSSGVCVIKPSGCKKGKKKTKTMFNVEMRSDRFRWRRMGC